MLTENANNTFERFALLFEFTGDQKAIRHVLYCCSASRPSLEGETKEDEKEVQTETLSLIASALANGFVKAKTSAATSKDIYNKWYDEVYLPEISDSADDEDEYEPTGTGTEENGTQDDETAGG